MKNKNKENNKTEHVDVCQSLLQQRKIFIYDEITNKFAKKITKKLYTLDFENNSPIQVRINSGGGSISAGIAIIDAMKDIKSPIVTYISGVACSMAAIISICGDERIMTRNSIWMMHPGSGANCDYFSFLKDRIKMIDLYEKNMDRILKEYTKLTKEEIKNMKYGECWYSASTCRKKGIVDKVKML